MFFFNLLLEYFCVLLTTFSSKNNVFTWEQCCGTLLASSFALLIETTLISLKSHIKNHHSASFLSTSRWQHSLRIVPAALHNYNHCSEVLICSCRPPLLFIPTPFSSAFKSAGILSKAAVCSENRTTWLGPNRCVAAGEENMKDWKQGGIKGRLKWRWDKAPRL